jgi:hypothetical protein
MERSGMMRCRPGTVTGAEFGTIPDQRRTASRCTASGKRGARSSWRAVPAGSSSTSSRDCRRRGLRAGRRERSRHPHRSTPSRIALRPAGRHDHVVADRGFIAKIDGEDVLGLHIVEAGEDQSEDLLCVKTHSGDRFGHATFVPRDYNCGQGCLSFRSKLLVAQSCLPRPPNPGLALR